MLPYLTYYRLYRLINKGRLEEAENFAMLFKLDLEVCRTVDMILNMSVVLLPSLSLSLCVCVCVCVCVSCYIFVSFHSLRHDFQNYC